MFNNSYNPDILSCLANLSSDEVFTPPELANQMLDQLPIEIWENPESTFLDPASKSGVFLREITKRLILGLEKKIPKLTDRINHILSKQVFGIAITELTSLLSRRTLYCSKEANHKNSIATDFNDNYGNIIYQNDEHEWKNNSCTFCSASKKIYERSSSLEFHAYRFIHTTRPQNIFNKKFDVIISNPPFSLSDGGGSGKSSLTLYHHFVNQAINCDPKYIIMLTQSRWFSGGKGLDKFRDQMLNDKRIKIIVDYPDSRICFPSAGDIAGGVCYFVWQKNYNNNCLFKIINKNETITSERDLSEFDTLIRHPISISILKKIIEKNKDPLSKFVYPRKPFGIESKVKPQSTGDIKIISSHGIGHFPSNHVNQNIDLISKWKILVSKASYDHAGQPGKDGKRRIFSKIYVAAPKTICTESYLAIGSVKDKVQTSNLSKYLHTNFLRFLVSIVLLTQNISRDSFKHVPKLSWDEEWDDDKLYNTFNLTPAEIQHIENNIKEMPNLNECH